MGTCMHSTPGYGSSWQVHESVGLQKVVHSAQAGTEERSKAQARIETYTTVLLPNET